MNNKKAIFLLALMLPAIFTGCIINTNTNGDIGTFGNENTNAPDKPLNETANGGSGGSATTGQSRSFEDMLQSGAAVQYQRVACYDPEMGCEAVRSVAPAGWQAGGQAYWAFQSAAAPATTDFFIVSPDNSARVGRVSPMSFVVPDPNYYQIADGQWYSPTLCPVKQYQNAETYAQNYFREYTGVTNTQLVEVEYPKGEMINDLEAYRAYLQRESDAMMSQVAPQLAQQNSQMNMQNYIEAAQVTLRFELNGVPCKAKVFVAISSCVVTNTQNLMYVGQFTEQQLSWNTGPVGFLYYMAEESKFDQYEAVSDMFFSNLIGNEQWNNAVQQVSTKLFQDHLQATYEQIMQRQREFQQMSKQYVDASKPSYSGYSSSGSSDANSRVMDGWTNVITDKEYYQTDDGGYTRLDNSYSHTYSNGSDFVQSNSAIDMPYGWNEVSGSTMLP